MSLDFISTAVCLIAQYQLIRAYKTVWFSYLLAISLNMWLYYSQQMIATFSLEAIFGITSLWGIYSWSKVGSRKQVPIQKIGQIQAYITMAYALGIFFSLYAIATPVFSSVHPLLESIAITLSLLGQYYSIKRYTISWITWLLADLSYAYLMHLAQLPYHTFLFMIYASIAIIGYVNWLTLAKDSPQESEQMAIS